MSATDITVAIRIEGAAGENALAVNVAQLRALLSGRAVTPRVMELVRKWAPTEWGPMCGFCGAEKSIHVQAAFCQACFDRLPDCVREAYAGRSVFRRSIAAEWGQLLLADAARREAS